MVKLNKHDLDFILDQIKLAEEHSTAIASIEGEDSVAQIGDELRELVNNPLLPFGLRTVDGSFNNLVPGREKWGASGEPFLQLTQPNWVNENDDSIVFGAGSPGQINFTDGNYGENGPPSGPGGLGGGTLVDADPRLISNLIVDQTLANPAAIAAALRYAGVAEADIQAAVGEILAAYQNQPDLSGAIAAAEAAVEAAAGALSQAEQAILDAETVAELPPLLAAYTAAQTSLSQAEAALAQVEEDAAAFNTLLDSYGIELDGNTIRLPNVAPDEGLSAPYNSWFTLFGQFFDHGLDLVAKGGNGTIYIPLQPDDPLYNADSPHTNFMVLTRASIGEDAGNVTTPWVDQNQTYTSHASHQVFLREYEIGADGRPMATGKLLEGSTANSLATWKDIKDQAREMLGIELTDADVGMVPLLRTDPYGKFIPDPDTGFVQVIVGIGADGIPNTADDIVISGTPDAPASLANAIRLPNAFLDDIAHAAVPIVNSEGVLQQDADSAVGYSGGFNTRGQQTQYDNELLDAHYVTGDGRGNENIGLTAIHFVFHSEHNRQIEAIKSTVLATGDADYIAQWQLADGSWNGERLFQAARFATEMQYQHLVFEEFARKVQPDVDIFMVEPDVEINPAIFAEFANVVYRFGHSMLNQTVDRTFADGSQGNIDLFDAFLNPLAFGEAGISQSEMAGAIALGMSAQRGNEIDEFVTDVLRNQLVGIPLDLAAINIARGRDTGMPTLNQARAQFQEMANGDTLLKPYESWADFALNLKNPESIINFIAAYGTHSTITTADTMEAKRAAAIDLVFGGDGAPADRLDFLNARGAYADDGLGGLSDVDLWIGGLAEKKMAFGGILGSTFSFIFQLQMENLQDADRFYYLSRTQGLNLLTELENNSLAKMVMRNSNLGALGVALPADIFSTPDHVLYLDLAEQLKFTGLADPEHSNPVLEALSNLVERGANFIRYNGLDHVVIQGTAGNDHIISGGGDDSVWGGAGNDRIEAGYGVDSINGGEGDDIITSSGTDIGAVSVLKGETGNDVIVDGTGISLIFGGDGKDFLVSGADDGEIRGGQGDDFIFGGDGVGMLFGNEGNDWIEGGGGFDYIAGDNGELFFNSTILGHDVLNGGQGDTDYDADSGDDIMFAGEGIQKNIGMWGHDWVIHQGQTTGADSDMRVDIFTTLPNEVLRDRFSNVEALSGWHHDDILRGDDRTGVGPEGGVLQPDPTPETSFQYNELNQAGIDRIAGLGDIISSDLMVDGEYWADGSWENGETGTSEKIFVGGNILLGGGGSDTIEGRGGDDVIDGDRYLNVRVTGQSIDGTGFSVSGLTDSVTLAGVTKSLISWMIEGRINPGTLEIVREILDGSESGDVDTAVYWDVLANYEVTNNGDGSYTVTHVTQTAGAVDPVSGRNRESDGTDRLHNIEQLQFADGVFDIDDVASVPNSPATGAPVISNLTPTETQALTTNVASIADADGIASVLAFQWQVSTDGGTTWTNIAAAGTGSSFTPAQAQVGGLLRVVISFTDGAGNVETLTSAPTGVVGDNWNAPAGNSSFNGTAGDDIANGNNSNNTLNGNAGNDTLNGSGSTDTLNGGAGDDRLDGGSGTDVAVYAGGAENFTFALNGSGQLTVTDATGAEGTDTLTNIEQLRFAGSTYTLVNGTNGNQTVNGGTGGDTNRADILLGHAGTDTLNGNGGNDILVGGAGNDTVNGGAGNDLILWRTGEGRDVIDGGSGTDTVHISGDATSETFRIYTRAAAVSAGITGLAISAEIVITRNGTDNASVVAVLDNIEEITINALAVTANDGGGLNQGPSASDTIQVIGNFASTSLNYSTITVNGGTGDDEVDISQLTSAHRIVFRSNGGNDTIVGQLRPQDVIEVAPGTDPTAYALTDNGNGTQTFSNGTHQITFAGTVVPQLSGDSTPDEDAIDGAFEYTPSDIAGLKALVNGQRPPGSGDDDVPVGVRELSGLGNNLTNPAWGSADQAFIRLTQARYGDEDEFGNRDINPVFQGLDARNISNILGAQEAGLPKAGNDANIFFMAMGQYIDHGLDFLPKGGNGTLQIGGPGGGQPGQDNPADLTRGTVMYIDEAGIPQHKNQTSPFVDQNQAYGSHSLIGQFLRESDGAQGHGSRLLSGAPDPSNPAFDLLPTLRELINHHWANNTIFEDPNLPGGSISFRDYYTNYDIGEGVTGTLFDPVSGGFDMAVVNKMLSNFMGSTHPLLLDANPYISVLDHYIAGDGRANENYALTSIHTIWARNHNYHVDKLLAAGFEGSGEELFQAAKMVNEAEYQRVVFDEYLDTLLGGLRGSGTHAHDGYNPDVDPAISHEFAAAVFRFGHSLIGQTMSILDEDGNPTEVGLFDAFLNPSNDPSVFAGPLPPGYVPAPGYAQNGVNSIIGGIVTQPSEDVDFNIVDAVRNDLVRIRADLFAFNVTRGWDLGIGTLNQVRMDLAASTSPYVQEAIEHADGDVSAYTSWEDFQQRNGLSDAVIAQFRQAYPDLVLAAADIAAFQAINPDIELIDNGDGTKTVKGIDRVDLWVGGLAERHINDGIVGQTFWIVLHEQFDRLQEADRFYYTDRFDNFDLYENFIDEQEFADIVYRNTGIEGLPEHMFEVDDEDDDDDDDDDNIGNDDDDDDDDNAGNDDDDDNEEDATDDDDDVVTPPPPASGPSLTSIVLLGTLAADTYSGGLAADVLAGGENDDVLFGLDGDDNLSGDAGNDFLIGGAGSDLLLGGIGNDRLLGGTGNDRIFGGAGDDLIFGDDGDDLIFGDEGRDIVDAGSGDDTIFASIGDGDDVYNGGHGVDTIDFSAITVDLIVNLLSSGSGSAMSSQSGTDTLVSIENVKGGSGDDTIIAGTAANLLDGGSGNDTFVFNTAASTLGDRISGFEAGDLIDLRPIYQSLGLTGDVASYLTTDATFTATGQLRLTIDGNDTVVEGTTDTDADAEFSIRVLGRTDLKDTDFA